MYIVSFAYIYKWASAAQYATPHDCLFFSQATSPPVLSCLRCKKSKPSLSPNCAPFLCFTGSALIAPAPPISANLRLTSSANHKAWKAATQLNSVASTKVLHTIRARSATFDLRNLVASCRILQGVRQRQHFGVFENTLGLFGGFSGIVSNSDKAYNT